MPLTPSGCGTPEKLENQNRKSAPPMLPSLPMIETGLHAKQLARYSRHIRLPEVGVEGQAKLLQARVLVIGAGGLGSPVAFYLAAAGVGTLGIADFDLVEEHNLQRQILHTTAGIGTSKTASARDRLLALTPDLQIELHEDGITAANAEEIFSAYDLIVDGSDNFNTRYLNNDAAFFARRPLIYGSIFRFEGQVSVFHPAAGAPCYRCLFPTPPEPGTVPNCAEAGVFGALCGVIGSMQAMEAIKMILGTGHSLTGKLLVLDALTMDVRRIRVKRDPHCPLCGATPSIIKIDPATYEFTCQNDNPPTPMTEESCPLEVDIHESRRLLEAGEATLVDVREPFEVDISRIPGSKTIPMGLIPKELKQLPKDSHLLIHCHHGGRSMQVTKYLRQHGFSRVSNVAGGIDAWAQRIDPSMQRY
jgi:sulfur-carrier protein adenylyltransferase/sulfurtransferase